jgi:hypothetical protein
MVFHKPVQRRNRSCAGYFQELWAAFKMPATGKYSVSALKSLKECRDVSPTTPQTRSGCEASGAMRTYRHAQ